MSNPTDTPPEAPMVPDSKRKGGCSAVAGSLSSLSKAWVKKLERAALQEESLRTVWEKHYKHKMTYDEFHMRRHLTLAVQRNEMDETYARELIAKHKANAEPIHGEKDA